MVKSKKTAASKKSKSEETPDVEAVNENSVEAKTESDSEKTTQENGEVDTSAKKKGKEKTPKKAEPTDDEENEETQENGDEDTKKKPAPKKAKAASKPAKETTEPARKSSRTPKPVAKEEEEESYEVEKLVDYRVQRGKPQYLVRWKGYTSSDDTWEDESSLNCTELLQNFKSNNAEKVKKGGKKRSASKSPSKTSKKTKNEEEDYEVEEVVGMRVKNGKKEFKIRWKGYKAADDSWEPEKHLSCQDLIEQYLENHKDEIAIDELKKTPGTKKEKTPLKSSGRKSRAK